MNRTDVQRRFDRTADSYDSADFVHTTTREGMLARLEPMTIDARTVVDLGCATGTSGRRLGKKFRRALIVSIDLSSKMLARIAARTPLFSKHAAVQADAAALPLANHCVDLVFANLLLPWVDDRAAVFAEVARVLRKNGLFVFSTLGPDSLAGLGCAPFADMHDVGDELVRARLRDPVLDVDRVTINFSNRESLERDFAAAGIGDCLPDRIGSLDVQLELVYGHCWGAGESLPPGEVRVAVSTLAGRRR